jgi:hypothetical protein
VSKVETKVVAGSLGSGLGGVLATFILWLLGSFVWDVGTRGTDATKAVEAVPAPVAALIVVVIPAAVTALAAWVAPHTHRPDLEPPKDS